MTEVVNGKKQIPIEVKRENRKKLLRFLVALVCLFYGIKFAFINLEYSRKDNEEVQKNNVLVAEYFQIRGVDFYKDEKYLKKLEIIKKLLISDTGGINLDEATTGEEPK